LKSSITSVRIDKNNLTNYQRIFRNEKDIRQHMKQTTNEAPQTNGGPSSSSVFNVVHSLDTDDKMDANKQQTTNVQGESSSKECLPAATAMACNPLLLSQQSDDQPNGNAPNNENNNISSTSNSLNEGSVQSNLNINRIFDDANEHVNIFLLFSP
jgi:hypothetical protein